MDDSARLFREAIILEALFGAIALPRIGAGAPSGLSRVSPSQAKPLITYRKEGNDNG